MAGPEGVELIDLGSHNGTLCNGERVRGRVRLCSGDVISVCYATLVFHQPPRHPAPSGLRAHATPMPVSAYRISPLRRVPDSPRAELPIPVASRMAAIQVLIVIEDGGNGKRGA